MKKLVSFLILVIYMMSIQGVTNTFQVYGKSKDTTKVYESLIKIELSKSESKYTPREYVAIKVISDSILLSNKEIISLLSSINKNTLNGKAPPYINNKESIDTIRSIYKYCYLFGSFLIISIILLFWIFIKININWQSSFIMLSFLILVSLFVFEYLPKLLIMYNNTIHLTSDA